ncbi:MAG: hypothetical protein PF574_00065 [Candidatus Delongbacteria bacterium]|jgi:hypothetical protein|nr:hypothetical protein [Candidatus Delongbacteria bacterium]
MKKFIVLIFVVTSMIFAKQFGVSIGTGTFAGIDDYSPKHVIGHYYMGLNDKFTLGFSAGFGMMQYFEEINHDDSTTPDEEFEISVNGIALEGEFLYFQAIPNSSIKPFVGLGLGIYSYNRDKEGDYKEEEEATSFGFAQFITFGLDMNISEKLSMFVQFRKLGFSMIKTVNEIDDTSGTNDDREETIDYLTQPGMNDLGITVGMKFNF